MTWAIVLGLGTIYEFLVYGFSQVGNFTAVFNTCLVFELLVAINAFVICIVFVLAARRMRLSKAKATDPGHLSRSNLLINFGLIVAMLVECVLGMFGPGTYGTYEKTIQTTIYITSWFVELYFIFILIRYELNDFVLRTVV